MRCHQPRRGGSVLSALDSQPVAVAIMHIILATIAAQYAIGSHKAVHAVIAIAARIPRIDQIGDRRDVVIRVIGIARMPYVGAIAAIDPTSGQPLVIAPVDRKLEAAAQIG